MADDKGKPPTVTVKWYASDGQWVVLVDTSDMLIPEPLRIEIDGGVLWDNDNHKYGDAK